MDTDNVKIGSGRKILLIVGGGIAAYKVLDLIRRLREVGHEVRCVLTAGGAEFVTPLSLAALSGNKIYKDLFDPTDEHEMGHIQLSRWADLLLVAPATADLIAKMTMGLAGDLATAMLLATNKSVVIAPAMNVRMWEHPATVANIATLRSRGIKVIGPEEGDMACGEYGFGRMSEPSVILAAIAQHFQLSGRLHGRRALVTSGPTWEPIDPVRAIVNRSSGRQGHAIATALASAGVTTTLVTGPTALRDPQGLEVIHVETARDMLAACIIARDRGPILDIAVCAAAVADWRIDDVAPQKLKKGNRGPPQLKLTENPDILENLSQQGNRRPRLVIGFAAETEDLIRAAQEKRYRKGCDWIIANDVSASANKGRGTFGGDLNTVHFITATTTEAWPMASKDSVALRLVDRIAETFGVSHDQHP
ncbi:MAG: bifunctional phosphopantothenoylcysteine decarboxylase/phosphopantothenate--cysteine ligase CoaBC [Alphaproteobacteria bacterium]